MRILLVDQFCPPEPDARLRGLATGLRDRGHEVTILTGFPNYPGGKLYPGYRVRWRQRDTLEGVPIERVPLYPSHDRNAVRRSLNYLSFAASALVLGSGRVPPVDLVWVYQPPLTAGLPAWWIARQQRVPYIHEVQDMWPDTLSATGMVRPGLLTTLLGGLAQFLYERAQGVVVISPGFGRLLQQRGVPGHRLRVIPNWADEDLYRPVPRSPVAWAAHGLAEVPFRITFAGNMGAAQDLGNVLAAAALLRDLPGVRFTLVGQGVDVGPLRERASREGLANVDFVPQQPPAAMAPLYAASEVLLVHLRDDPLFRLTIPSKTIAYLACGRPILSVTEGDPASVVLGAGAGLTCPPGRPEALAAAVRQMVALAPAEREAMGARGRAAFLARYSRRVLLDDYEDLFWRAVKAGGGTRSS